MHTWRSVILQNLSILSSDIICNTKAQETKCGGKTSSNLRMLLKFIILSVFLLVIL